MADLKEQKAETVSGPDGKEPAGTGHAGRVHRYTVFIDPKKITGTGGIKPDEFLKRKGENTNEKKRQRMEERTGAYLRNFVSLLENGRTGTGQRREAEPGKTAASEVTAGRTAEPAERDGQENGGKAGIKSEAPEAEAKKTETEPTVSAAGKEKTERAAMSVPNAAKAKAEPSPPAINPQDRAESGAVPKAKPGERKQSVLKALRERQAMIRAKERGVFAEMAASRTKGGPEL